MTIIAKLMHLRCIPVLMYPIYMCFKFQVNCMNGSGDTHPQSWQKWRKTCFLAWQAYKALFFLLHTFKKWTINSGLGIHFHWVITTRSHVETSYRIGPKLCVLYSSVWLGTFVSKIQFFCHFLFVHQYSRHMTKQSFLYYFCLFNTSW